jgi:hypothetical protein
LGEAHKVPIGGQVLDRPVEGPLVQRIDEIQGWMSPAPVRLYGYARPTARECV